MSMLYFRPCIISAIFIFIYFTPVIFLDREYLSKKLNYENQLQSNEIQDTSLACLAASFPLILDFLTDVSFGYDSLWNYPNVIISKSFLILSLCIPNLAYRFGAHFTLAPSIFYSRFISLVLAFTLSGAHYGFPVWTEGNSSLIITLYGIGSSCALFALELSGNIRPFLACKIVTYVLLVIILFSLVVRWVRHLLRHRNFSSITFEEHCTNLHLCAGLLIFGGLLIIGSASRVPFDNPTGRANNSIFIAVDSMYSGITVILFVAYTRITRRAFHLKQANRELEIKSSFVRYVSHEIRTPLNTVVMGLKYLHTDMTKTGVGGSGAGGNGEWVEVVEDLQSSCEVAVEILTNLLTYEKISTNILELERQSVPVRAFFDQTLRPFVLQGLASVIDFKCIYKDSFEGVEQPCFMNVDKAKISQVVRNLLSNAFKFTKSGGQVHVSIQEVSRSTKAPAPKQRRLFLRSLYRAPARRSPSEVVVDSVSPSDIVVEEDGLPRFLRVEVTDSGPGIAEENQKRLFKEIVQFNPGELQDGKGSGLGLWISHQIMTLHEGSLSVYSAGLGHGCTFTMELPLIRGSSTSTVDRSANLDTMDPLPDDHWDDSRRNLGVPVDGSRLSISPGVRVLIVDDAGLNRRMMIRVLRDEWENISEAEDGRQAVELVRETLDAGNPFDIVLMDYQMPRMDGPTAAKRMREMGFEGIIIGVTGNALPIDIETYLSHGADKILIKPLQKELLKSTLEDLASSGR